MPTSELHQTTLKEFIKELEKEGYRVIDLNMKSPDAIALKNKKIYAVEVLGRHHKKGKGWAKNWTHKSKKQIYDMFDGLIIKEFRHTLKK